MAKRKITQSSIARSAGVSRQAVHKSKYVAKNQDGSVDIEKTAATLESIEDAQRRKEIALADTREMERDEKRGLLVNRTEIEAAAFNQARAERDALMSWPGRVSPVIAAELDVNERKLYILLEKQIRLFLEERHDPAEPVAVA